jgi:hypothetical protein
MLPCGFRSRADPLMKSLFLSLGDKKHTFPDPFNSINSIFPRGPSSMRFPFNKMPLCELAYNLLIYQA